MVTVPRDRGFFLGLQNISSPHLTSPRHFTLSHPTPPLFSGLLQSQPSQRLDVYLVVQLLELCPAHHHTLHFVERPALVDRHQELVLVPTPLGRAAHAQTRGD